LTNEFSLTVNQPRSTVTVIVTWGKFERNNETLEE